MLTKFETHNFRSIDHLALRMRPFMVFVGPNGAGKTNIIRAVELLGETLYRGTTDTLMEQGWEQVIRRRTQVRTVLSFAAEIRIPIENLGRFTDRVDRAGGAPEISARISLSFARAGSDDEVVVKREEVRLRRGGAELKATVDEVGGVEIEEGDDPLLWDVAVPPFISTGRKRSEPENHSEREAARQRLSEAFETGQSGRSAGRRRFLRLLSQQRFYIPWLDYAIASCRVRRIRLDSTALRWDAFGYERPTRGQLGPSGEGLAEAVLRLRGRRAEPQPQFMPVLNALRDVFPRVVDVRPEPVPYLPGRFTLSFKEDGVRAPFGQTSVSDGTIHTLALLIALHADSREPISTPRVLAVEEPENAIHPWAIQTVMQQAQESKRQVLVTSHSPSVVNEIRDPQTLFIVNHGSAGTTVTPAVRAERKIRSLLRSSGSRLGDLWLNGSLGGVPQPE